MRREQRVFRNPNRGEMKGGAAPAPPPRQTVNRLRLDSFLPSSAQTAPVAWKSVVTGSATVTSALESGVTVIRQPSRCCCPGSAAEAYPGAVRGRRRAPDTDRHKQPAPQAGYYSARAVDELNALGTDPFVAPEKTRHGRVVPPAPRGRIPSRLSPRDRMRRMLSTERGRQSYALRIETVEPVFGQIKQGRGFRQFLLRGLEKVNSEWSLTCTGHNLLKLFRLGRRMAESDWLATIPNLQPSHRPYCVHWVA